MKCSNPTVLQLICSLIFLKVTFTLCIVRYGLLKFGLPINSILVCTCKQACVHAYYILDFPSTVCGIRSLLSSKIIINCFCAVPYLDGMIIILVETPLCVQDCCVWASFNTVSRSSPSAPVIPMPSLQLAVLFTNHCALISLSFQYTDSSPAVLMTTIHRSVIKRCMFVYQLSILCFCTTILYCYQLCDPTISYQYTIYATTTLYWSVYRLKNFQASLFGWVALCTVNCWVSIVTAFCTLHS